MSLLDYRGRRCCRCRHRISCCFCRRRSRNIPHTQKKIKLQKNHRIIIEKSKCRKRRSGMK